LLQYADPVWAVAGASLLFGLCHWLNTTYAVFAFSMGIVLGILYWQFGLVSVIATHAAYDFLAILVIQRTARTDSNRKDSTAEPYAHRKADPIDD
jgi:membrane protease YdiL (CAAX protease family)